MAILQVSIQLVNSKRPTTMCFPLRYNNCNLTCQSFSNFFSGRSFYVTSQDSIRAFLRILPKKLKSSDDSFRGNVLNLLTVLLLYIRMYTTSTCRWILQTRWPGTFREIVRVRTSEWSAFCKPLARTLRKVWNPSNTCRAFLGIQLLNCSCVFSVAIVLACCWLRLRWAHATDGIRHLHSLGILLYCMDLLFYKQHIEHSTCLASHSVHIFACHAVHCQI